MYLTNPYLEDRGRDIVRGLSPIIPNERIRRLLKQEI